MVRTYCAAFSLVLMLGCAPDKNLGNGDGDGGVGDDSGTPVTCTSAEECGAGVCDPATNTCSDSVSCGEHTDCGAGAHCKPDGTCASSTTGDACATETQCTMNEGCVGGYCGCGGDQFLAKAVPPNVLILLDRSGSMNSALDPIAGGPSKYDIAETAIESLLTTYGATVNFGLAFYPSDNSCGAGTISVDVGVGTAATINTEIDNTSTGGSTPIAGTLAAAASYTGLQDDTRENYILLLTDGQESCNLDDDVGPDAATALHAQTPPVKTFVVGFGGREDPDALDALADAGGTATVAAPASPRYYVASDAVSLSMALDAIGGAVLSCTYLLDEVPESADFFIYFDNVAVASDMSDGWTYDSTNNTVTFYGGSCDSLRTGVVGDLVIVHNCPVEVD